MEEWKNYVPKSHWKEFKEKFTKIVETRVGSILNDACYHGTHHSYYECPEKGCDYCLDDSDDRDIKESTTIFHRDLWCQVFDDMNMKPIKRQRESDDDEDSGDDDDKVKKSNNGEDDDNDVNDE